MIRLIATNSLRRISSLKSHVAPSSISKNDFKDVFIAPKYAAQLNIMPKKSKFPFFGKTPDQELVGVFCRHDFKNPENLLKAINICKEECTQIVEKIAKVKPGKATVRAVDELSNCLCNLADPANFLSINHPDEQMRQAAAGAGFEIGCLVEQLNNEIALHSALLKAMEVIAGETSVDEATKLVGTLFLRDFEQCGVGIKDDDVKKRAISLSEIQLELMQMFQMNIDKPGKIDSNFTDLPDYIQEKFKGKISKIKGSIEINTPWSTQRDEIEREAVYRAYHSANLENGTQMQILENMLDTRFRLAQIYGYDSWAQRTIENSLARSPEFAVEFLERSLELIKPEIEREKIALLELKKKDNKSYHKDILYPWDETHYGSTSYDADHHQIEDYLTLTNCMNGISLIANSLFGFDFKACETKVGEVWNSDVVKLEVSQNGLVISYIYLDLFSRESKSRNDCHYTITCSRQLDQGQENVSNSILMPGSSISTDEESNIQIPIVVVGLNFHSYNEAQETRLNYDQAKTLFHEFGHVLHSIAGRTDYQHVSGTRVATDIAEVPSILNEIFFNDERIIQRWAKDSEGNPVPLDLWKKFSQPTAQPSHYIELGNLIKRSLWDQKVHGCEKDGQLSPSEHERKIFGENYTPQGIAHFLRFSHILQYDGKFYAYQLSTAMAGRIWEKLFKDLDDPLDFAAGQKYLNKFLCHGGSRCPREMYKDLLEEEIDLELLAETMIKYSN